MDVVVAEGCTITAECSHRRKQDSHLLAKAAVETCSLPGLRAGRERESCEDEGGRERESRRGVLETAFSFLSISKQRHGLICFNLPDGVAVSRQ